MPQSFQEVAVAEPDSEQALAIVFGLNSSEREAYERLCESDGPLSVQELSSELDCALTTAYRIVDSLETHDLVETSTIRDSTCQRSVYDAVDPAVVAQRMEARVDQVYTDCRDAIEAFAADPVADCGLFGADGQSPVDRPES
ncbi:Transcriptional regulator, contains HTH domain [Halapricum desulfuricans]|uniref:Transcriptional regulator, contains HTH domain n=1 Tax=Halapricum desulfuricans TaxID=2841257 RepID=A0A897NN93_9EURY|nr:helix-turn-helix domain-containing protein [Halapricum desulfuricans]QSG11686.1 Transcriptional regulator, contains HTH domain [Halapricum desulfuricans]